MLADHPDRIALLRARLADLSWFMRALSEPIARRANKDDICKGWFWAGFCSCKTCIPHIPVRQRPLQMPSLAG
jgi:hypothetical protein